MSTDLQQALDRAIAASHQQPLEIQNYIDSKFVRTDKTIDSYDPSIGKVWAKIPDSQEADVEAAVQVAQRAFTQWSQTTVQYRSKILMAIADQVEAHLDAFAIIESRDQGKPVNLAKTCDIPRCVHNLRFFATAILRQLNDSTVQQVPVKAVNYVTQQPIGVAGLITPWNLPLYLLSFKIAPALAAGCTIVAKPSEFTSVTAWLLAKAFNAAGLPPGVVNFVFGTGCPAGQTLVTHPNVPVISFTGGTCTGRHIQAASAPYTKRVSLEMGGKNACIVFADCDLDKAVPTITRSCFMNQGEICLCTSRLYVHDSIYDTFMEKMLAATTSLFKLGDPRDPSTTIGAICSKAHYDKVMRYIQLAKAQGATFLCGLEPLDLSDELKDGYFIRPTILTDVSETSALMTEEIFGPVVCVQKFTDTEDVIRRANSVEYGLSASLWSQDVNTVHNVAQRLHVGHYAIPANCITGAGTVWCNCWLVRNLQMPFGGMKASGIGRDGDPESIEFYTEKKTICIKLD